MTVVSTFQATPQHDLDGRPVLGVKGDIDLASAPALLAAAEEFAAAAPAARLLVDLGDVTFMDSTGLGALITIRNGALERGCDLEVTACSRVAERAFELAGLADIFGLQGKGGE